MTQVEVPRGETIFHEGDPGDRLYVIVEGKIKLGRASGDRVVHVGRTLAHAEATLTDVRDELYLRATATLRIRNADFRAPTPPG